MIDRLWLMISHNLGTKVVSVVIAIVLWVVVLGSRAVEVTKEIPLEVVTSGDVTPANELPDRIAFRLSGPKAFLRTISDRREEPVRVNLVGAKPGLITYRFFSDNIHLPIGVKVLSISPTYIQIKLEPLRRRELPVHLAMQGVIPEGYRIASSTVVPDKIRVKGPESRVEAISEVATAPIDLSHMRQNLDREVPLELSRYGLTLDGPLPRVKILVEALSANFRIRGVDLRVLSSFKSRVEDHSVTVLVRADAQGIKLLDRARIFGVVDLNGRERGTYRQKIQVTLPDQVSLVKMIPEETTVTLY